MYMHESTVVIEALAVWLVIYIYCCIDYFAQVDVTKVWLKDDIDKSAYFPYVDGSFRLDENPRVASYATLLVEGSDTPTVTVCDCNWGSRYD